MDKNTKKIILDGVLAAGEKLKECFSNTLASNLSKVTTFDYGIPADKESEKILLEAIKHSGLSCEIIAEESGILENPNAEYSVFIDPLDGTVNFSRGIPFFCIGIALFKKEEPILGIVYDPMMNELFVGEKGKGVTLNDKRIRPRTNQQNLLVNFEWFGAEGYEDVLIKLKNAGIRARTAGSGVLAITYGAIGRGDGSVSLQNKPWDVAPGLVMATELGLRIEQLDGGSVDIRQKKISMIAAPEKVFRSIKAALRI